MLDAIKRLFSAFKASLRAHMWYWVGGAGVVLVGVAAALLIFGDFFGPSGKTVCQIARFKAVEFGVLGSDAKLQGSGKAGEIEGRRECTLISGNDTYVATTVLTCKNVDKELSEMKAVEDGKPIPEALLADFDRCISLYAVERSDGLTLYQKQAVPPDDAENGTGDDDSPVGSPGRASDDEAVEVLSSGKPQQAAPEQTEPQE